jgi:hypothetical protein
MEKSNTELISKLSGSDTTDPRLAKREKKMETKSAFKSADVEEARIILESLI